MRENVVTCLALLLSDDNMVLVDEININIYTSIWKENLQMRGAS